MSDYSRQYRYQARNREEGRCSCCGKPRNGYPSTWFCEVCAGKRREQSREYQRAKRARMKAKKNG